MDVLIALLSVRGPCTCEQLARASKTWRWLTRRRLYGLWDEDLVGITAGDVWRLTDRGRARAEELRKDEGRFAWLTRTR